jgi:protein-S-isoprenylcysteine O-methyltransferase Ste14
MTSDESLSLPPHQTAAAPGTVAREPSRQKREGHFGGWELQLDAGSIAIGGMILWFAGVHLRLWIEHPGVFVGLGQVILELVQGTLFFLRRRDTGAHRPVSVWAATIIGSWGFLLARPIGGGYFDAPRLFGAQPLFHSSALWIGMQLVGTVMAILSLSSLGRSFGLLAANRGLRTGGAYRIVRHPAYASYFVVQIAYLFENLSLWNVVVFAVVVVAQLTRIAQEEAFLSRDSAYASYAKEVRYRLVPGVY